MAVLPRRYTPSGNVEVLLGEGASLLVVTSDGAEDQQLTQGPFCKAALSGDGTHMAVFTTDGRLLVLSSDFGRTISEFPTKSRVPPLQLAWCGSDSVLLYWERVLLMIGPKGEWVKYTYDEPLVVATEVIKDPS